MKTFLRVCSVICLIGWMGLIFYFSAQTAEESSEVSGSVIEVLAEKFYPEYETLTPPEKQDLISSLQSVVRSTAHYCIYGGLGFFAFLTFISYTNLKYKVRVFWMLETCLLYSVSDEFHQTFVDGRAMQLTDIIVDFAGILTAVLICSLFVYLVRPLRRKVTYFPKRKIEIPSFDDMDLSIELTPELQIPQKESVPKEMPNEIPEIKEIKEEPKQTLSEEFQYASSIIGKTVIEATMVCNNLTKDGKADTKELVNLVLGRTEVLKAEILKILNSNEPFEIKKDLMQNEQMSAFDYFDSIKAQI